MSIIIIIIFSLKSSGSSISEKIRQLIYNTPHINKN